MPKTSRLTLVISHLGGGGAERVMTNMANYWAEAGQSVTLLSLADDSEPPAYDVHKRVLYIPLGIATRESNPVFKIDNVRRLLTLRRAVQASSPDAVISFIEKVNVTVLLACLGTDVPILVTEQVDPESYKISWLWEVLRKLSYPLASRLVLLSERTRSRFPRRMWNSIEIIPNPVHVPSEFREYDRWKKRTSTIIAMGRLDEQKGFDILLRAFAIVRQQHPEWKLVILGEGPKRGFLERLRADLHLVDFVKMPGWIPEPHKYLAQSSIYVMSSRFEGFPNALTEAMACGLPVISTDCPTGPREIITEGVDGLLVPADDVGALAGALDRLISDERERERLGRRAQEVTHRFGMKPIMGKWEEVLSDVLGTDKYDRTHACNPP